MIDPCGAWQDMLLWVLKSIEMYFSCGYLQKGDLTTRQISSGGGNKGVVDLWMYKRSWQAFYWLHSWTNTWTMLRSGRL